MRYVRHIAHMITFSKQYRNHTEQSCTFSSKFVKTIIASLWKGVWPFIWTITWIPFTQGISVPFVQWCFMPSLVEIRPVVLEKKLGFEMLSNVFLLFSPIGKGRCHIFEQIWISCIKGCFVLSLVEVGSVVKIFKRRVNIFSLCRYYLPLEKGVVLYVYEET